jgi:hypothetical protein
MIIYGIQEQVMFIVRQGEVTNLNYMEGLL